MATSVSAGVGVANCKPVYVQYEPYKSIDFSYTVLRPSDFRVFTQGVFSDYYSYTVDGSSITGTLTLPPDYNVPGTHPNYITVTEMPSSGGTAVGVASVNCPIYVEVPYPGKYLTFRFSSENINTGDELPAHYEITSRGNETIYDARITINVVKNAEAVAAYSHTIPSIMPADDIRNTVNLQTQDLSPGLYDVNAYLSYGNKTLNASQGIRVGSLDINVLGVTSNVTPSPYTRINFTLENNWNNPVNNVYVTYTIKSADLKFSEVQTPSINLGPFEKKKISSIAETPGIVPGSYFITYQVHFEDNTKKGTAPLFVEKPVESNASLYLMLSGILLTVMLILIFILVKRGRKQGLKEVEMKMKGNKSKGKK